MVHKKPLSGENLRGLERTERERVAEKSRKGKDVPNTYVRRRINLSTVKWDGVASGNNPSSGSWECILTVLGAPRASQSH